MQKASPIFVEISQGNRPLGKPWRRWVNKIKLNLRTEYEDWIKHSGGLHLTMTLYNTGSWQRLSKTHWKRKADCCSAG
jgi:hypothetical protein